jgi:hypothetical protein
VSITTPLAVTVSLGASHRNEAFDLIVRAPRAGGGQHPHLGEGLDALRGDKRLDCGLQGLIGVSLAAVEVLSPKALGRHLKFIRSDLKHALIERRVGI